jgi:hypothetical protein
MPKHLWKPVPAAVVEAAWQAQCRGLSLRAIAAELASKGMLSPSERPYLPGSIVNMLRDRDHVVDRTQPAVVDDDLDPEVEMDEPGAGADAVDAVPTLPAALDDVVGPVDAAPPADIEQPAVDVAPVKPRWQAARGQYGLVDFRSLLQRLCEFSQELQVLAMASANLRIEQMGLLADRGDWRETVANWLAVNT